MITTTNYPADFMFIMFMMFIINLILLLFHQHPAVVSAQTTSTYQNISLGSSLTTTGNNTAWLSPSGDFAFGFLPLPTDTSLFLLAIWFTKTNNSTIVWYANGDSPVPNGSRLKLVTYGVLILSDNNGNSIWTSNASGSVSYAALLNTGNLILADSDNTVTWQSFDHPQDTLLPTQTLPLKSQLRSHLNDDDFSGGRFVLQMQGDGDVVMSPLALPTNSLYESYWASSTAGVGNQIIFNSSGDLYLEFTNKTLMKITSSSVSTTEFYQRVTLDPDGVLRHYVYPKNKTKTKTSSKSWSDAGNWTVVDYEPSDICMSFGSRIGSGACGFNSYCLIDKNHRRSCECPTSYSFVNPDNPFLGCKPDFALPSCSQLANSGEQEGMFEMKVVANTDWVYGDYENYVSFDEDQCRDNCLKDCFCVAALFSGLGNGCYKKRYPLSNGRSGTDIMGTTLLKVAKTNFTTTSSPPPSPSIDQTPQYFGPDNHITNKDHKVWIVVGPLALSLSLLILFVCFANFITKARRRRRRRRFGHGNNSSVSESDTLRCFTFRELEEATSGFTKELGRGSSGIVYEGIVFQLRIAVKKLDKNFREIEKEFIAELQSIGRTHHKNLVQLYGYCNEGSNRLLVYEFMSNGSLTSFLFEQGTVKRAWNKRVEIAMGIARGVLYLHEECSSSIIHCDIKPQNILLDDDLNVRISDFGLAKLLRSDQTGTLTGIRGTKGYIAPEWFNSMPITNMVDVYSFGVILLEIICCRRNLELENSCEEKEVLVYWAYDCYIDGKVELLIGDDDDDDDAMPDIEQFKRFLMLAIWCVQEDPSNRPTMRTVNQVLDGVVAVPAPPNPSSDFSKLFSRCS